MIKISEVEKLSHSQPGLLEAYRRGLMLQEKGWMLYPAANWDDPAILAFVDDRCVAGINWSRSDSSNSVSIDFAWCSPDFPIALTKCLLRLRTKLRENPPSWLAFTCHRGNSPMERLVKQLELSPHSHAYRVPETFYRSKPNANRPLQAGLLARIWTAIKNTEPGKVA